MTTRVVNAAVSSSVLSSGEEKHASTSKVVDFATLGRAPGRMSLAGRRLTSRDLEVVEATPELLSANIPSSDASMPDVSLLQGFKATTPSSERAKLRRRKMRHVETAPLRLKQMQLTARGLLLDDSYTQDPHMNGKSLPTKTPTKQKRVSLGTNVGLDRNELERQAIEIGQDREHITVRRVCHTHINIHYQLTLRFFAFQRLIRTEIEEIDNKIAHLNGLRRRLEEDLLKLHEEDLELQEERTSSLLCSDVFC
jgi:division protein 1